MNTWSVCQALSYTFKKYIKHDGPTSTWSNAKPKKKGKVLSFCNKSLVDTFLYNTCTLYCVHCHQ